MAKYFKTKKANKNTFWNMAKIFILTIWYLTK